MTSVLHRSTFRPRPSATLHVRDRARCAGVVLGLAILAASAGCSGTHANAGGAVDAASGSDATTSGTGFSDDGGAPITDGGPGGGSPEDAEAGCVLQIPSGSATSAWAAIGANGQLTYETLPTGERLLDFSYAGYMGGGVALPTVAAATTLSPSGGDDTSLIQNAIDTVSKAPLANGFRGAVVLAAGTFQLAGSLTIAASGVVLRGAGSGAGGTSLQVTGSPRNVLTVAGTGKWATSGAGTAITDSYVPSGARSFHVADASGLSVGQAVLVQRPVTEAWIAFMGMADLSDPDAGRSWLNPGDVIHADRNVTAISGNLVTIDAPLSDSYDAKYTSASVVPYTFAGRIEQVGIEGIHVVVPPQVAIITDTTFQFLAMDAVLNGWVRDVASDDAMTGIVLDQGVKWVTIDGATLTRTSAIDGGAGWPFQFSVAGQQTLIARSTSVGTQSFPYATQAQTSGPNVVLDLTVTGASQGVQPHQRWATGLLADNVSAPGTSIDYINRGVYGTGHGWTMGFGVVWNAVASTLILEQPPGSTNWAIGSSGTYSSMEEPGFPDAGDMPQGIVDSKNVEVAPKSLYLAQLCQRLGPTAVTNIGFTMP
jgi:hypothetical protein